MLLLAKVCTGRNYRNNLVNIFLILLHSKRPTIVYIIGPSECNRVNDFSCKNLCCLYHKKYLRGRGVEGSIFGCLSTSSDLGLPPKLNQPLNKTN